LVRQPAALSAFRSLSDIDEKRKSCKLMGAGPDDRTTDGLGEYFVNIGNAAAIAASSSVKDIDFIVVIARRCSRRTGSGLAPHSAPYDT
jgi:hypothetical protein